MAVITKMRATGSALAGVLAIAALAACGSSSDDAKPAGLAPSAEQSADDLAAASALDPQPGSFLHGKTTVTQLAATTPANGDVNPYAVLPVVHLGGALGAGDVLVGNFNDKSNNQGTGTTIVNVHPDKSVTVFADIPKNLPGCPGGIGLTTALVQLKTGWVLVGSLPTTDGKIGTAGAGCLIELDPTGKVAGTITDPHLNGPWDAVVADNGDTAALFVSNVLGGVKDAGGKQVDRGTVVRLSLAQTATAAPHVTGVTEVATGLPVREDAAALVKGPTGVALDAAGNLYVGDNLGNRIAKVPNALTRTDSAGRGDTVSEGGQLAGPLAVRIAPNGNLLAANATNGKIVEITPAGQQVGEFYAIHDEAQHPAGNGDLFGIAIEPSGAGLLFVGDDTNTLSVLR
ncbi:NHL repeat-containing protein [Nocardia stercoris]|uniref:ScyD/ScyE family protein n=1 Tax=Nocardia stercoris TaxID=2483361 RepID=A0A3M2LCU7_9NOCA|nr:hypothetical protein [Nocardia stercoris]RMI34916.1 hypothetical protein EBN03_00665 [Nocardia stercoris]